MAKFYFRKAGIKAFVFILFIFFCPAGFTFSLPVKGSADYVREARAAAGKRDFQKVYSITQECISKFSEEADSLSSGLSNFPEKGKEGMYKIMNDVATCYFIQGEALMRQGKTDEAIGVFKEIIKKYPYAQAWDPRGWFWSLKEKAEITIKKLTGRQLKEEEEKPLTITKDV